MYILLDIFAHDYSKEIIFAYTMLKLLLKCWHYIFIKSIKMNEYIYLVLLWALRKSKIINYLTKILFILLLLLLYLLSISFSSHVQVTNNCIAYYRRGRQTKKIEIVTELHHYKLEIRRGYAWSVGRYLRVFKKTRWLIIFSASRTQTVSCTWVGWKVHRLTKKELCHSVKIRVSRTDCIQGCPKKNGQPMWPKFDQHYWYHEVE